MENRLNDIYKVLKNLCSKTIDSAKSLSTISSKLDKADNKKIESKLDRIIEILEELKSNNTTI